MVWDFQIYTVVVLKVDVVMNNPLMDEQPLIAKEYLQWSGAIIVFIDVNSISIAIISKFTIS